MPGFFFSSCFYGGVALTFDMMFHISGKCNYLEALHLLIFFFSSIEVEEEKNKQPALNL